MNAIRQLARLIIGIIQPSSEAEFKLHNSLVALTIAALFVFLYLIPIHGTDVTGLFASRSISISIAVVSSIAIMLLDVVVFAHDPLQYDDVTKNKHARFFQSQFPSKYIAEERRIDVSAARNLWFTEFNKLKAVNHPNHEYWRRAFLKGYECRRVYHTQIVSKRLALASCIWWLLIFPLGLAGLDLPDYFSAGFSSMLTLLRIGYPVFLFSLDLHLGKVNNVDKPSGVWLKWKQHNETLRAWWDKNNP